MSDLQGVAKANRRYAASKTKAEADKEALFEAWVAAAMSGYSPEEIAQHCDFGHAYIRRIVRERGVEPLPPGRKGKK